MISEITIFDVIENEPIQVTKSQKELEYEEFARVSKIDKHHVRNLFEMEIKEEENKRPETNISSILCKWLIRYCDPLLYENAAFGIFVSNEVITECIDLVGNKYIGIAANQQIKIVGLKLPELTYKKYDKFMWSHFDRTPSVDIAATGIFGLQDFQTDRFTQQREEFVNLTYSKFKNNYIFFNDDADAIQKMNEIINYINFTESYYESNYSYLFGRFRYPPYGRTNLTSSSAAIPKNKRATIDKEILETLNEYKHGKFGQSYDCDINMDLTKNTMIKIYNVGKMFGTQDKLFKNLLQEKKSIIENEKLEEEYINLSISKTLDLTKRQAVAWDKYEIEYDDTTEEQKKIIEIELVKIEKTKTLSPEIKELQKQWGIMKKAINDIDKTRLETSIKTIIDKIPKEKLTAMKLIEGGLCPHIFKLAEVTLKNFSNPNLNIEIDSEVTRKYSLPKNVNGFYCKLCGEQIAEADNETISKVFQAAVHQNDPLQSMIWKEAMYAVTKYVRFSTPTPVKQFVSSLASGLRGVIAEEEFKLFKRKTSSVDSIKDTISLYAVIYIYASLCVVMMLNPNKIIFGKEKISEKSGGGKSHIKRSIIHDHDDGILHDSILNDTSNDAGVDADDENSSILNTDYDNAMNKRSENADISGDSSRVSRTSNAKSKSHKVRRLRGIRGGKVIKDVKLYERYLLTTALNLILISKDSVINKLKTINTDIIKQIFLKQAYVWATNKLNPLRVEKNTIIGTDIRAYILRSPIYEYTYFAKMMDQVSHGKEVDIDYEDITFILGRPLEKLDLDMRKGTSQYDTITEPEQWKLTDAIHDEYTYLSYKSIMDFMKNKLYEYVVIPPNIRIEEYYKKNIRLFELEKKVNYRYAKKQIRPVIKLKWKNDFVKKYNNFSDENINMFNFYCPSGEKHKISKRVYATEGKEVILDRSDIVEWFKNDEVDKINEFKKMKIIDDLCSNCNNRIRNATGDLDALNKTFERKDDLSVFSMYYESRCPEGDLHEIESFVCKKCKLDTRAIDKSYFDKYVGLYKKIESEKNNMHKLSLISINNDIKNFEQINNEVSKKTKPEYKYTLQKIAELSQLVDIKYNILINLGLSEGIKYSDIENGKVNPSRLLDENPQMYSTQSLKIKSYILYILRTYNLILKHEDVSNLDSDLRVMVNRQKNMGVVIDKMFPDFKDEFILLDNKYKNLEKRQYNNFLLEYLSNLIIRISKESNSSVKVFAKEIIVFLMDYILSQEKLYSKAESIYLKMNVAEVGTDTTGIDSETDLASTATETSSDEFEEREDIVEGIDNEGYDVENVNEVWDVE